VYIATCTVYIYYFRIEILYSEAVIKQTSEEETVYNHMQHKAVVTIQQLSIAPQRALRACAPRTEPHRPWEGLPGQRNLFSLSPDVCLQLQVSPISAVLLPRHLALVSV